MSVAGAVRDSEDPPMTMRLHHVGCAVPAIGPAALLLDRAFGWRSASEVHEVPSQRVRVAFLTLGGSACVELVEPTGPDSPVQGILDRSRGGPYHLCYEAEDLDAEIRRLRELGFLPVNRFRGPGPGGRRFSFLLDPQGQLVELCGAAP